MKVVIMAGGRGTRIASVNSEVPKPMIKVAEKPILEHQILGLKKQGLTDFILVIGYLGDIIKDYFGDGSKFGVKIKYFTETEPLGTAGALFFLKDDLTDDFLLINGDLIFDVNVKRFYDFHKDHDGLATLFTHPNSHPYDSGIIFADENDKVTSWLHKEDQRLWYKNRVNAGLHMLSNKILDYIPLPKKTDLDRDLLKPLIPSGEIFVYDSPEYVKDMGTPERLLAVEKDIYQGIVENKNLAHKQRAVFLDRDGTINEYVGFLRNIDEFKLLPNVSEAVKMINEKGYLAIVVTNQPVIARGEVTEKELKTIHDKMETLLGEKGAYIDDLYYCPHHPDKGFEGEVAHLKIKCNCRKPHAGMLFEAAKKYNIDLKNSWMVGDRDSDLECGKNAKCKTAIIGNNNGADICGESLFDCISKIFNG